LADVGIKIMFSYKACFDEVLPCARVLEVTSFVVGIVLITFSVAFFIRINRY